MIILKNGTEPTAIYYGNRPIKNVFVGTRLVWPAAIFFGIKSFGLCKTHAAFVLNNGTLWTTGSNRHGQLCRIAPSGTWNTPNLAPVPGVIDAVSVAVSCTEEEEGSTVVLREHSRLFSAGFSTSSRLAVTQSQKRAYTSLGRQSLSGNESFSNFGEALGLSGIRRIFHGRGQLIVERSTGVLYGYGLDWDANRALLQWIPVRNSFGQNLIVRDLILHARNMAALHPDGSVGVAGPIADWFRPSSIPVQYQVSFQPSATETFWTDMRKITAGQSHLAGITKAGFLRMAGSDQFGQLCSSRSRYRNPEQGVLFDDQSIQDVACGAHHTVILYRNGHVKTGGLNHRGQLGRTVPVGNGHDWLYFSGKDRVSEEGWFGNSDEIPGISDATAVYAGGDMTMIFCKSGIYVCGDNEFGQLGTVTDRHIVNSDDRLAWRESWQGVRTSFETNLQSTALFASP